VVQTLDERNVQGCVLTRNTGSDLVGPAMPDGETGSAEREQPVVKMGEVKTRKRQAAIVIMISQ
jgi:hypothetical protein